MFSAWQVVLSTCSKLPTRNSWTSGWKRSTAPLLSHRVVIIPLFSHRVVVLPLSSHRVVILQLFSHRMVRFPNPLPLTGNLPSHRVTMTLWGDRLLLLEDFVRRGLGKRPYLHPSLWSWKYMFISYYEISCPVVLQSRSTGFGSWIFFRKRNVLKWLKMNRCDHGYSRLHPLLCISAHFAYYTHSAVSRRRVTQDTY